MTISATATAPTPTGPLAVAAGAGSSDDARDFVGFAEQFHGLQAQANFRKPLLHGHGSDNASQPAPEGDTEPADNTDGAAILAALLFGIPGAIPVARPMELHLHGDSLPPVKTDQGPETQAPCQDPTQSAQPLLLTAGIDTPPVVPPLEAVAAAPQSQPPAAAAALPAPPLPDVEAEAVPQTTELAFAARMKPGPATPAAVAAPSPSGDAPPRVTAVAELRRTELESGRNQNADQPPPQHTSGPAAPTFMTADGPVSSAPAGKTAAPAAAATHSLTVDTAPVKSTQPLKELTLQVANQNQERVDVQLVERGGELHVAVRTGSADLAQGLRAGISDLVDRLQETGLRTDTWRPVHAATAANAASGPQQSATQFRNQGDPQSNSGWSQQQARDQRNPQHSNRPAWVEELEGNYSAAGEPLQGDKHGLFR